MMSAAILLPTGLEKTNSLSVSSDLLANQIEPGMVCFAEKFNERVGEPHVLKGNISEAAIPSMKVPGRNLRRGQIPLPLPRRLWCFLVELRLESHRLVQRIRIQLLALGGHLSSRRLLTARRLMSAPSLLATGRSWLMGTYRASGPQGSVRYRPLSHRRREERCRVTVLQ